MKVVPDNSHTPILDRIAVSKLIDLLDHSRPDVIRRAIKVLTQLAHQGEFPPAYLCCTIVLWTCSLVEDTAATRTVIVVLALPMIVHLLDHSWRSIGEGSFALLTELAHHGEFPPSLYLWCCGRVRLKMIPEPPLLQKRFPGLLLYLIRGIGSARAPLRY